jgi:hypothetical protein
MVSPHFPKIALLSQPFSGMQVVRQSRNNRDLSSFIFSKNKIPLNFYFLNVKYADTVW